jgi:CheY-like chemotaxis protein
MAFAGSSKHYPVAEVFCACTISSRYIAACEQGEPSYHAVTYLCMNRSKIRRDAAIFLVEDEALIRMMIVGMLDELGYSVVAEAGNIQEGMVLAETAAFDLALLDINVGGESIVPVAEIIRRRGLPLVFITGYAQMGLPEPFVEKPVLQKPFVITKLADAIENVLG